MTFSRIHGHHGVVEIVDEQLCAETGDWLSASSGEL